MKGTLTLTIARSFIQQATEMALEKFDKPICVSVCDEYGFLLAFERMDGAPVRSILISQCKAYTAVRMGVPTHEFLARIQRDNILPSFFCDAQLTALPGGSVIRSGDGKIIGGIGVSALAPSQDQEITETISAQTIHIT